MSVPLAELMEKNPTSRFKVLPAPNITPGKCAVCGSVDRPVVDFGLNIARYGAVMICVVCLSEAGLRIGLISPEEHNAEVLQAGQTVRDFLEQHNLKVISHELYNSLTMAFINYNADLAALPNGFPDRMDDKTAEVTQRKFRLVPDDDSTDGGKSSKDDEPFDV